MHIPPYYKIKSWQRFIIGMFTGGVIAYIVFIFMYGSMYEKVLEQNLDLQSKLSELESQNETLLQDQKSIDENNKIRLTVERIEVVIMNSEQLRLDRFLVHQLSEMIKTEIDHVIGQDIYIVSESDQLLLSTIENKSYTIDDFTYAFEVKKLTISHKVKLTMLAKISE